MRYTEKWTKEERRAMQVTQYYTYTNFFIRNFTLWGHRACKKLRKCGKEQVIDLGCGTGEHFPYIHSKKIIGVDVNEDRIWIARKRFPYVDIRKEDIFNLSFKDNSVDSIVSVGTLEHLDPLEDALKEINRIMTFDGEFIFCIPTEGLIYRLGRNITIKRYVEKTIKVDYLKLLEKEHINMCKDILDKLKKFFIIGKLVGVPFRLPIINLNIFIVGRCLKK